MQIQKISIVVLGHLKYPLDISKIEKWQSSIFKIHSSASVNHLPNPNGSNWEYSDDQLRTILSEELNSDFTVGLTDACIENNYYMRRISEKTAVLSFYQMAEICRDSNFTLEQYILRNIYELAVLYQTNGTLITSINTNLTHDAIRGCIFDMNANKLDIIFSLHRPKLCLECKARISSRQIPTDLIPKLEDELQRIRKPLFFRLSELIKNHPIFALIITAFFSITLNLLASIIFEKAKNTIPWLGQ